MTPNYIALIVCHAGVLENATARSVTTSNSNILVSNGMLSCIVSLYVILLASKMCSPLKFRKSSMQIPDRKNFQKITLGKLFQYEEI